MSTSAGGDDEKEPHKGANAAATVLPLDLARNQLVRTADGKATPLVMTSQSLRGVRVLTQGAAAPPTPAGSALLTANLVQQAVIKSDGGRGGQVTGIIGSGQVGGGSANITLQRPAQITLSTAPLVAAVPSGTSYHVPRGPAVVASLAAPRSNVTTVRQPMVVSTPSGQTHAFVRPPRTPSPAQNTAWLTTNSSNGSQIKGAPTVLSSPVRGATVTGKPQLITRCPQPSTTVSAPRTGTILQNAITLGQPSAQIHAFKPGGTSAVTIAQVLPSRTQAVVYNANTTQFTPASRIAVTNTVQTPRQTVTTTRPLAQVTTARLTVPVNVTQAGGTRIISPQATVLSSNTRISVCTAQPTILGSQNAATASRLVTTQQQNATISRVPGAATVVTSPAVAGGNLLGQKISALNLHSLVVPVAGNASGGGVVQAGSRPLQTQMAKVITQPTQGTIHLASLPSTPMKSTPSAVAAVVTTTARTISVPAAIVTQQRQNAVLPPQAISITKVFPQQQPQDNVGVVQATVAPPGTGSAGTNVFIHAPIVSSAARHTSPSPTNLIQSGASAVVGATTAPSLPSGTFFYDATGGYSAVPRVFGQPVTASPALSTSFTGGIVANQQMRFNQLVVVEPQNHRSAPSQQFATGGGATVTPLPPVQSQMDQSSDSQQTPSSKIASSPRPSILRKRDHEGSPLKAAKNLTPVLSAMSMQQHPQPIVLPLTSPPSRPDSRGNGHSSGGSTTISATSSPGLAEVNEDSMPMVPMNKEEEDVKPPAIEMSPRKKPRKQQLTGHDLDENNDDMQFISESTLKKEPLHHDDSDNQSDDGPRDGAPEAGQVTTVRKPASASLLNSYKQSWKATHNHYLRYSDVRPKDERKPTIMDLANQYRVQEKVNGWKIHHLSTQMEDLADQEQTVYNQLTDLLKYTESQDGGKFDDVNRVNELIKGNLQRIKIINDGMLEAKTQIMKIFDHKVHVTDIINRCASKRNFKKREKS